MLRRAVALLTLLFVSHVSLASGGVVCPMTGAATTHTAASHEHEHRMSHDASSPAASEPSHRHAPVSNTGCLSVTSCGVTVALADAPDLGLEPAAEDRLPAIAEPVLHSIARAPELPPPRA